MSEPTSAGGFFLLKRSSSFPLPVQMKHIYVFHLNTLNTFTAAVTLQG